MYIWEIIVFIIAFVLLSGLVTAFVVSNKNDKKRKLAKKLADQVSYDARAPYREWVQKIRIATWNYPKEYNISLIEPPPEFINEAWRRQYSEWIECYENAKSRVAEASQELAKAKRIADPLARRSELADLLRSGSRLALSLEDQEWMKRQILEVSHTQATDLWTKAQAGDGAALAEFITFTNRSGGRETFVGFTDKFYPTPRGWLGVISEHFEAPTLDILRTAVIEDGALLLLTETAIREASIIKAKIVLAHWLIGQHYQLLIPQEMITKLIELVEHHHAEHSIPQKVQT